MITPGSDPNITGYGTGPADNAGAGVGATAPPMFQPGNKKPFILFQLPGKNYSGLNET